MSEPYDPCGLRDVIREAHVIRRKNPDVDIEGVLTSVAALDLLVDPTMRHADLAKHCLALGQEFARGHGTEKDESGRAKLGEMAAELAAELDRYEAGTRGE